MAGRRMADVRNETQQRYSDLQGRQPHGMVGPASASQAQTFPIVWDKT
jgi:hypothetical protein